ncbi:MAG: hypothetical protein M3Q71_11375 [Chloroflexota bacterium]|nr:hypothetical protein [Chloroflexota bacterium]
MSDLKHDQQGSKLGTNRAASDGLIRASEPKRRMDPGTPEVSGFAMDTESTTPEGQSATAADPAEDEAEVEGHNMGIIGEMYATARHEDAMRDAERSRLARQANPGGPLDGIKNRLRRRDDNS